MNDYSEMSDFEINKAVAKYSGYYYSSPSCTNVYGAEGSSLLYMSKDNGWSAKVDYCNNPADAWPIIIENKISIINDDGEWNALSDAYTNMSDELFGEHHAIDKNPLRAAMIVFLMMNKEVEK